MTPRTSSLSLTWDLPSPEDFLRAFCEGTARTGPTLRAQTPGAFNAIRTSVLKAAASYSIDGRVKIPMGRSTSLWSQAMTISRIWTVDGPHGGNGWAIILVRQMS